MPKKQYAAGESYEKKLYRVMERLGAQLSNYNWDRFGCWVEFRYKGELYRFEHSVAKAQAKGVKISFGSDAFAQVVLALEDLARMVERGIYDLSAWIEGMRFLPPPVEVPTFLRFLGFDRIPGDSEEIKERYRTLAKQIHPDAGGSPEDFAALKDNAERAIQYLTTKTGGR